MSVEIFGMFSLQILSALYTHLQLDRYVFIVIRVLVTSSFFSITLQNFSRWYFLVCLTNHEIYCFTQTSTKFVHLSSTKVLLSFLLWEEVVFNLKIDRFSSLGRNIFHIILWHGHFLFSWYLEVYLSANISLFKVNNKGTRKRYEMLPKLTVMTHSGLFCYTWTYFTLF